MPVMRIVVFPSLTPIMVMDRRQFLYQFRAKRTSAYAAIIGFYSLRIFSRLCCDNSVVLDMFRITVLFRIVCFRAIRVPALMPMVSVVIIPLFCPLMHMCPRNLSDRDIAVCIQARTPVPVIHGRRRVADNHFLRLCDNTAIVRFCIAKKLPSVHSQRSAAVSAAAQCIRTAGIFSAPDVNRPIIDRSGYFPRKRTARDRNRALIRGILSRTDCTGLVSRKRAARYFGCRIICAMISLRVNRIFASLSRNGSAADV